MSPAALAPLSLGSGVVQRLIPHRAPFLMVDRVEAYVRAPEAALRASRCVTAGEPFFAGHFPKLAITPGALILEGLAQAAALLLVISGMQREAEEAGRDPDEILLALANLELGDRLEPGFRPEWSAAVLGAAPSMSRPRMGMLAQSQVKFLRPVFPGEQIFYDVRLGRQMGALAHFDATAEVRGQAMVRGTLTLARVEAALPAD